VPGIAVAISVADDDRFVVFVQNLSRDKVEPLIVVVEN
jgi:hypothetical protein